MKKKILNVVASLLVGFGLFILVATANATPAYAWGEDCPNGQFCTWSGLSGTGTPYRFPWSVYANEACWNLTEPSSSGPGSGNNNWESVYNDYGSPNTIYVNDDFNCSSAHGRTQIYWGQKVNLNVITSTNWRNRVSSFRVIH